MAAVWFSKYRKLPLIINDSAASSLSMLMGLTLLLAPEVYLCLSYHLSPYVSPLLLLWIKVTDGRTSRWLCFMGWEDPREKCFHFPEPPCALLHGALSHVLSSFVSHVSLSTSLSFSLSEQMEHILCSLSAPSALRKYYNKADMPCIRTDLICQRHFFKFVNCTVLQPCHTASERSCKHRPPMRASFIVHKRRIRSAF